MAATCRSIIVGQGPTATAFSVTPPSLVGLKPDLIVGQSTPAVAALLRATRAIPIVFVNVSDPIGSGFIESLSRPGSNITGFSNFEPAMGGKWVGFLKEIAPYVTRIALMSNPATSPQARGYLPSIETAARSLGLQPIATPVHDTAEIERAIAALGRDPGGGLVMLSDGFTPTSDIGWLFVKSASQPLEGWIRPGRASYLMRKA